jgi:ABC-type phosphate transport system auxiliary subunit
LSAWCCLIDFILVGVVDMAAWRSLIRYWPSMLLAATTAVTVLQVAMGGLATARPRPGATTEPAVRDSPATTG